MRAYVREVNRVDPDVPIAETITLPLQMAGAFTPVRASSTFLGYAAGLAALLSALGIYGTLTFSVSRRTKEIGIRMAIGEEANGILAVVLREGMTIMVLGVTAGLGLAVAGKSVVRHLLYGSAGMDALLHAAAESLLCMGLLACSIPARRAASLARIVALRDE
jgi:putative ABC transport system permease protein